MSTLATDEKVGDSLSDLDPGLVEMARAFLESLIHPVTDEVKAARFAAGKTIFQALNLEMGEGKEFAYEWVAGFTNYGQDGTHADGSTANPLTGLNHNWFECAAQGIKQVHVINVREGLPQPSVTQLDHGIRLLVKWIEAAQVMPDIQINSDGELLRNRDFVNLYNNHRNDPWLRTKITDKIKPVSAVAYLAKDNPIGEHVGCEGGIHLRRTSLDSRNALFCSGCGLRITIDAGISTYEELSEAWVNS